MSYSGGLSDPSWSLLVMPAVLLLITAWYWRTRDRW